MIHSAIDERIRTLYEVEGLSPEVIASEERLHPVAVKSKLMQISSSYRKACNAEPEEEDACNFTKSELIDANSVILETMRSAETPDGQIDWRARFNAAAYVRDDKKGRKELKAQITNNRFNVLQINEDLSKAAERAQRVKEAVEV